MRRRRWEVVGDEKREKRLRKRPVAVAIRLQQLSDAAAGGKRGGSLIAWS